MLISRIFNICNNSSNTISIISMLMSRYSNNDINNLFNQLEENNIIGDKLYNVWINECNSDYNKLITMDYSKFDDKYFMNNEFQKLTL